MRAPNQRATRATRAADRRRGAAMVVFAMIVFALMGVAAIAIDIGLASLAQAQMQTAVDTAALEGVQHRDFQDYRWKSNSYRRPRASELVRHVFDDDFHPTVGVAATDERPAMPPDDPDQGHFGAGPMLSMTPTPGMAMPGASQTMSVPAVPVLDDPVLQFNGRLGSADLVHGDMLSGVYVPDNGHAEADDYLRSDFNRAQNSFASRQALGFLVRMRRTNGANALDSVTGVSSGGPTVPLLFGIGAAIRPADGSSSDPRIEGLTVRAAAIAVARPALAVGPVPLVGGQPIVNRALPGDSNMVVRGLAPVAIEHTFWESLPPMSKHSVDLIDADGDGMLDLVGKTAPFAGTVVGRPIDADSSSGCKSIGRPVVPTAFAMPTYYTPGNTFETYFPIYADIVADTGTPVPRVIGYGYGRVALPATASPTLDLWKCIGTLDDGDATLPPDPPCFVIVAADNASAHLSSVHLDGLALSGDEWDRVFAAHVDFCYSAGEISYRWQDIRPGTLLAPALVR